MATRKKAPTAWNNEVVDTWAVPGTKAQWRAQVSTSPQGVRFAGIRKVFVKQDGSELMAKDGFSIALSDEHTPEAIATQLRKIAELVGALADHISSGKKPKKPAGKKGDDVASLAPLSAAIKQAAADKRKVKAPEPEDDDLSGKWVLKKDGTYLKSWTKDPETGAVAVRTTTKSVDAMNWGRQIIAQTFLDKRKKSLASKGWTLTQL